MAVPVIPQPLAEEEKEPSRTYGLDLSTGRIIGKVDGIEAVKQAILKILDTNRFGHFIYSENYGIEQSGAGGYSFELQRLVTDALLQDDRIVKLEDFQTTVSGDELFISFTVVSIYGPMSIERRMDVNV